MPIQKAEQYDSYSIFWISSDGDHYRCMVPGCKSVIKAQKGSTANLVRHLKSHRRSLITQATFPTHKRKRMLKSLPDIQSSLINFFITARINLGQIENAHLAHLMNLLVSMQPGSTIPFPSVEEWSEHASAAEEGLIEDGSQIPLMEHQQLQPPPRSATHPRLQATHQRTTHQRSMQAHPSRAMQSLPRPMRSTSHHHSINTPHGVHHSSLSSVPVVVATKPLDIGPIAPSLPAVPAPIHTMAPMPTLVPAPLGAVAPPRTQARRPMPKGAPHY
eukprot:gnl/Dysnectes_brevis/1792_a2053_1914.p1 GENE.gnl/Dysnectes_brevis/1792_a2053_1914~~gnl/Dysnectes_brevis/1792_a2053_1914.p1  ORF type:complete len:321 (-),score=9.07 gnl/Dysnectes_brevis/1792_a2053_1914:82-903(-)